MSNIEVYGGAKVDTATGEIVANQIEQENASASTVPWLAPDPYTGMATTPFSPEQCEKLLQPIPEDSIEIRPDGPVYLPGVIYRRILNTTFGPGAWAIHPRGITLEGDKMYYKGALFVLGRFISEAIGEAQYHATNDRQSYATASESAKTDCLTRCCKDLGIASELWDPAYNRRWIATHAVEVWCVNQKDQKKKKFWRKKSAAPYEQYPWKEEGGRGHSEPRSERSDSPAPSPSSRSRKPSPAAPKDDPLKVTRDQRSTLKEAAANTGWKSVEYITLLRRYGFAEPSEITIDAYQEILTAVKSKDVLDMIRKDMADAVEKAREESKAVADFDNLIEGKEGDNGG